MTSPDEPDSVDKAGFGALPIPTAGVDNRTALAMGMQAAPGAYAVLVGSGMSRAAKVPTAWEVIQDLVRQVATAEGVDLNAYGDAPELWWEERGCGEPRYDTLIAAVAPTEASRQRLLSRYFDPVPSAGGPVEPTFGHQALANLIATERARLILTTNLDRLVERALDRAGVVPQVITAPEQVKAMTPLTHAQATVIKLHGDYMMLGSRNTPDELATYPPEWQTLLERVFEEFGLVVIGWSAEWDTALAETLASAPRHAYPVFWTAFNGDLTEAARRLIGQRKAAVVETAGADEFLADLSQRIARLDQSAARRRRPQRLFAYRSHLAQPAQPPPGWSASPLLRIRAVALASPVHIGESDSIGPEQRDALCAGLRDADATNMLRMLTRMPAAWASPDATGDVPASNLGVWHPTPSPYQSGGNASYRLGGDAESGISALASVQLPGATESGHVTFLFDCGLSVTGRLLLLDLAFLLRYSLLLTTGPMLDAMADVLPAAADIDQVELYVAAPIVLLEGGREPSNDLSDRVDLSPLGESTRPLSKVLHYAAQVAGPLVERDAAELVVEAIRAIALDSGYLDPRIGLRQLRAQMGLSPTGS